MATQPASYGIARDQLVAKSGPTALVMALCHYESWWRTPQGHPLPARPAAVLSPRRGALARAPHQSTPFAPRPSRGTRTRPTHTGGSEHDD